jgi:outer membrane efflux protein
VAIANKRYRGGLASYYEVLEAQQLLFPAEIALSLTRHDRLLAVVQLYKALGGGLKLTDAQWAQGIPEFLGQPVFKIALEPDRLPEENARMIIPIQTQHR